MPSTGIVCPQCSGKTLVTDSRTGHGDITKSYTRRRRKCVDCGFRCTTFESLSLQHASVTRNVQRNMDVIDILMGGIKRRLVEIDTLIRHER